jgi:hypothetical protein
MSWSSPGCDVVMAQATEALDLTEVQRVLEAWQRVAWLTTTKT